MSNSVTFSNGHTYTDDSDPTTGLDGGGWRDRFVPCLADVVIEAGLAVGSAKAAALSANASKWVSGTTYAQGFCVWSPTTYKTYRRKIAGAGTTDPASDSTNWDDLTIQANSNLQMITALTTAQILALSTAGIAALSTAQIATLKTGNLPTLAAMTTAQVATLGSSNLQTISALSTSQIQALGTSGIAAYSTSQIAALVSVPHNTQSDNYTCVLADAGKSIVESGSSKTITIPANSSVAYPNGTTLTFVNNTSGTMSIAITTDTMYLAGTATTGTRTIAQRGMATAFKVSSTSWIISGGGLS